MGFATGIGQLSQALLQGLGSGMAGGGSGKPWKQQTRAERWSGSGPKIALPQFNFSGQGPMMSGGFGFHWDQTGMNYGHDPRSNIRWSTPRRAPSGRVVNINQNAGGGGDDGGSSYRPTHVASSPRPQLRPSRPATRGGGGR